MKNWKITMAIALLAIGTAAVVYLYGREEKEDNAAKTAKWDFLPEIVATFGDEKITKDDFLKVIHEVASNFPGGEESLRPDMIRAIAPRIISAMVEKRILLQLAQADGIKPSSELVMEEFNQMLKEMPEDKLSEFKNSLAEHGKTIEDHSKELSEKTMVQEDAAIGRWVKMHIKNKVNVSEEQAKKYYDEHQEAFTKEERVSASHILIKSKSDSEEDDEAAKKRSAEIKEQIQKGEITFEKAAEDFSDCPSGKSSKGDLGEFARGDMIKEFEDAAFSMKEGEISDPVKTVYGYHIIKVMSHKDKTVTPFEEVSARIIEYLQEEGVNEKIRELLDKKKAEMNLKINLPEQDAALPPIPGQN